MNKWLFIKNWSSSEIFVYTMWSVLFVNPVPTFFPEANKTNTPFGLSSCQTIAAGLLHEILILFPFSLIREATMIHQCTNHYRFYFHFNNKKKHCKTYHWLFPVFCNLFIDQQTPTLIQHTCPKYQCPHDEYWMTFKQKKQLDSIDQSKQLQTLFYI